IERRPAALSGGQRQRVALARCLAGGARTILMDEPLANLDPHLRATMEDELMHFHKRSGVTTVYITHDQREAMALGDRLAVMEKGRFLQVGSPQDIYGRPNSDAVANFIGRGSILKLPISGKFVQLGSQKIEVKSSSKTDTGVVNVLFRPQDHRIVAENGLRAKISNSVYRGGLWEGSVALEGNPDMTLEISHEQPLNVGSTVSLEVLGGWVLPSD
ncbi:MAG: ABC transporter ATP-binding protein, partial [Hyphomicrobiales bacterium]